MTISDCHSQTGGVDGESDIVHKIFCNVIYSHVWRMNNARIAKFALEGKVEGKRRVRKPKLSWLKNALKRSGLNLGNAIETAYNRLDWKRLREFLGA